MFSFHLLVLVLAAAVLPGRSAVAVVEPLDSQLPLIARVDKPYLWTISTRTFGSSEDVLRYTTSSLPDWLSFNSSTLAFGGNPVAEDAGDTEITVTAHDSKSSASSTFILCTSPSLPPQANLSLSEQFYASNPSLSSVFLLSLGSAIASPNPALRVPLRWSFSIGFESSTFVSTGRVYYQVRQVNGSELPSWLVFNPKSITLNGVVPGASTIQTPETVHLELIASEIEGYAAAYLPFDIVLADHELSLSALLPTINVTVATPFSFSLLSPADFSGVLVDGRPAQRSNISTVMIDTSVYSAWLKYDNATRTLSGNSQSATSSSFGPTLPMKLTTVFNQTINTNVTLALVPSFFTMLELPPLNLTASQDIDYDLKPYIANENGRNEADLMVAFNPSQAGDWLSFDTKRKQMTGIAPDSFSGSVAITFTAYSHITHSTSHATLSVSISPSALDGFGADPSTTSTEKRRKISLSLAVGLAVIGGLAIIGGLYALLHQQARKRRQIKHNLEEARNLGLTTRCDSSLEYPENVMDVMHTTTPNAASQLTASIRGTFRSISDVSMRKWRPTIVQRPVISKPTLITAVRVPFPTSGSMPRNLQLNPLSPMPSAPSNSSILATAQRRIDFQRPRFSAHVQFDDNRTSRHLSSMSYASSVGSEKSLTTHASEAVVQTASRVPSVRSWRSASVVCGSRDSYSEVLEPVPGQVRLVPPSSTQGSYLTPHFVPKSASREGPASSPSALHRTRGSERAVSPGTDDGCARRSANDDEMEMGMVYVQSLGFGMSRVIVVVSAPPESANLGYWP
ncbi:hypothetical protein BDQ12DRAFT_665191 [Crucibulum laeve]|uniref:Dystroglycan-type cadherin-like domain-containing protein n=1 Tax=Crucibulum laeve TaxID=68775 RepID=A0A5C3M3L0_9AGAR|nr:hypothetical protein BDQ12DRAFT_665191 [Crucibulum laeve]